MKKEIKFSLVFRDMWQSAGKYVPRVDQLVKVALSSMVALFGTYQITQWCGAEHLVAGGHHGPCHGAGVHHRYRPVHGRTEY